MFIDTLNWIKSFRGFIAILLSGHIIFEKNIGQSKNIILFYEFL